MCGRGSADARRVVSEQERGAGRWPVSSATARATGTRIGAKRTARAAEGCSRRQKMRRPRPSVRSHRMHLRILRLRGFKSFPDTLELKLEPGVAVVVGPNGSGKSNIADAIGWAAGSLTPSELRAEQPDDVLFAGGGDRPAADHCAVEPGFDNADGRLGDLR